MAEDSDSRSGGKDDRRSQNGRRSSKRRRRRRKRRKPKKKDEPKELTTTRTASFGRRQVVEVSGSPAQPPASGRNPHRKRSSRAKRSKPGSVTGRRRRLSRVEMSSLTDWLDEMPDALLGNLYKGLGGQPGRVPSRERMTQLAVRAIAQGKRLRGMLKQLHERDRKALGALLQAGGVAHADELHRTLSLTFGGHENEWKRCMKALGDKGIVTASHTQDDQFFYIVPDPLIDGLLEQLADEMELPTFEHDDVRVVDHKPFCPPLTFSIASLATYLAQHHVRLTQRQEVYRHDKEEMDAFFSQLWDPDGELFQLHLDFLRLHGMIQLRGETLHLEREVVEEWLQLEPEDQRDLVFHALEQRFELSEWVLWAVHGADGAWVAERPLVATYRLWKRGKDWRARFKRNAFGATRTSERDSFTFSPLVQTGLLEMGLWGQEKFYRLTERARALLEPPEDDGFRQFYLTPDFKMMAPAGLAPVLLYRMGEIAELTGCDRANTYKITEDSIESALELGWRRDDVLQFLRDNSQIGLPDNVESTLKGWIGHRGDVEFHDLLMVTVHRSQIRRFEGNRRIKPYLLHRFAPGLYAVDRRKKDELAQLLEEQNFSPAKETRAYPGDPETVEARDALHRKLGEAREAAFDPASRDRDLVTPSTLQPVPGTKVAKKKKRRRSGDEDDHMPPKVDPGEVRALIDEAMGDGAYMEMVYLAKNGQRLPLLVEPQRLAFKGDSPVLVGLDCVEKARRTFVLDRIERLRLKEADDV